MTIVFELKSSMGDDKARKERGVKGGGSGHTGHLPVFVNFMTKYKPLR